MQLDAARAALADRIGALPTRHKRLLIALAGPPASGKSTLAEHLATDLPDACVVPMDGFHLDNAILRRRGLQHRKGSPETFDVRGFEHLLKRLQSEDEVVFPVFDRSLDRSIAGAGVVDAGIQTVLVEGNYLLLDAPGWQALRPLWDYAVYLAVPEDVLRTRLMERWHMHGFSDEAALEKIEVNDLPNAKTTAAHLLAPDLVLEED